MDEGLGKVACDESGDTMHMTTYKRRATKGDQMFGLIGCEGCGRIVGFRIRNKVILLDFLHKGDHVL